MTFTRGVVVYHKIMGRGIVLNEIGDGSEKKIEVRMANGQIEKFYPEELETEAVVVARQRGEIDEVNRSNAERAKKLDPWYQG
jgi:hypothetical protein